MLWVTWHLGVAVFFIRLIFSSEQLLKTSLASVVARFGLCSIHIYYNNVKKCKYNTWDHFTCMHRKKKYILIEGDSKKNLLNQYGFTIIIINLVNINKHVDFTIILLHVVAIIQTRYCFNVGSLSTMLTQH